MSAATPASTVAAADGGAGAAAAGGIYASGLSASQLAQFDRDGYLVLPDFFSEATAEALKGRADALLRDFDLASHPKTVFKSNTEGTQTAAGSAKEDKNKYFLDSASNVSFFFEADAFSPVDGSLLVAKEAAINKIGHYLHELDPAFKDFTYRAEVKALARSVGLVAPVVLQSMVILKQPRIGGVVTPHRDSTFLYTEPSTAMGMWYALEDCTTSNGCLSFVPGSHKDKANSKRFGRVASAATPLVPSVNNPDYVAPASSASSDSSAAAAAASSPSVAGPNNSNIDLEFTGEDRAVYSPDAFVPAEVKRGSLVLIHGEVVHASTANRSERSRYIYTFHLIDANNTTYPKENWLQSATKFPTLLGQE